MIDCHYYWLSLWLTVFWLNDWMALIGWDNGVVQDFDVYNESRTHVVETELIHKSCCSTMDCDLLQLVLVCSWQRDSFVCATDYETLHLINFLTPPLVECCACAPCLIQKLISLYIQKVSISISERLTDRIPKFWINLDSHVSYFVVQSFHQI